MKPDADISGIYVEGIAELQQDRIDDLFGPGVSARFDILQREFLNSAAHLLDLEHEGRFRFFSGSELLGLVQGAGVVYPEVSEALGEPPQAVIVSAQTPR
jgi:hypothetical protein